LVLKQKIKLTGTTNENIDKKADNEKEKSIFLPPIQQRQAEQRQFHSTPG
jgi:hypothetical protein